LPDVLHTACRPLFYPRLPAPHEYAGGRGIVPSLCYKVNIIFVPSQAPNFSARVTAQNGTRRLSGRRIPASGERPPKARPEESLPQGWRPRCDLRAGVVYAARARAQRTGANRKRLQRGGTLGPSVGVNAPGAARCTSSNGPAFRRFLTHFTEHDRDAKPGCHPGRSQVSLSDAMPHAMRRRSAVSLHKVT
jgi:hypothetical protein